MHIHIHIHININININIHIHNTYTLIHIHTHKHTYTYTYFFSSTLRLQNVWGRPWLGKQFSSTQKTFGLKMFSRKLLVFQKTF